MGIEIFAEDWFLDSLGRDVENQGETHSPTINQFPFKLRVDEASSSTTYVGLAIVGALESSAVWRIFRVNEVGTITSIDYADGDTSFDNVWDDRAGLSYS